MAKHPIQRFVYSSSPIKNLPFTVQIFESDGSPASLTSDYAGLTSLPSHEFYVTTGFFRVYVEPGLYNVRVFNDVGERWYRNYEAGEWSANSKHNLQYSVHGGNPLLGTSADITAWDAITGEAVDIYSDAEGASQISGNVYESNNGHFSIYVDDGIYNIKAVDNRQNEFWLYDVEAGATWEDLHIIQHPVFSLDPVAPVLSDVTVEIRDSVTDALVSVFSDKSGANALLNPFVATGGFFRCYVASGIYNIEVSKGGSLLFDLLYVDVGFGDLLAGGCDVFTSDEYWEPAESFYDYTWTGSQWERPFEEDSTFNFVFLPVGAWKSGYRKPILNLTLGSGEDTNSGGFLSAINVILYDDQLPPNEIGSGSVNFESYEQTKDLQIALSFGDFDIGFIELQTFLYSTGPIISKIEFCDE